MMVGREITIKHLRTEAHEWTWSAERYGFGWRYLGTRAGHKPVCVQAFSIPCGPAGDDYYTTQWMVDDGETSVSYVSWWLREAERMPPTCECVARGGKTAKLTTGEFNEP